MLLCCRSLGISLEKCELNCYIVGGVYGREGYSREDTGRA